MQEKKFSKSKIITLNALLFAIICLFVLVPITIGVLQLAFIPIIAVIISSEVLGIKNGAIMGCVFGVVSLVNQFIHPGLLAQAFYNPLVSILPRIMIGVASYAAAHAFFKLVPKCNRIFGYAIGSACGVVTNTVLVLGTILAFHFGSTLVGASGTSLYIGWQWIAVTLSGNFLIELAVCTLVTPPIIMAIQKVIFKS